MKKGVSITALTMYVAVLTIILGVIAVFNINILADTNNFVSSTKMYEQYSKFNMFFLELLGENPTIEVISEEVVLIYTSKGSTMVDYDSTSGIVRYTTTDKSIVICEYVDEFAFAQAGNMLNLEISFRIGDVAYTPQLVGYAVGGWAQ